MVDDSPFPCWIVRSPHEKQGLFFSCIRLAFSSPESAGRRAERFPRLVRHRPSQANRFGLEHRLACPQKGRECFLHAG
ncbi:hypothetical protein MPNT_140051 [Candidatus Methylacidithermus pantelleriae]|uniref:Uncharacterized protein n=1 Tax=Candidatus Methylacidithermus pantelleriae TaxID=2744239 RepID=A0A8J2FVI6_9BACT|nr:hypothetical protein MPNT_140051 [Candidatus Methylacidithermus pantelleriae]